MSRTRFVFAYLADMSIRVGTFTIVTHFALDAARHFEWSIPGIALGILIYIVYGYYLWSCMNAEHALTMMQSQLGMYVRVKRFGALDIRIDGRKFVPWVWELGRRAAQKEELQEAA